MANDPTSEQYREEMKKMGWYSADEPDVPPKTRELLEQYSKIPSEQVVPHVKEIRDKAWAVHPYPCVGTYRFLDLAISTHPLYTQLISLLSKPDTIFLDLGCALGQDVRRLVHDGVPSAHTYGADLRMPYMQIGYDLFLDRESLKTTFLEVDVFDEAEVNALGQMDGKVDVLQASAFFHLFGLEEQRKVARRVVKLVKPGGMLVGQHVGNIKGGEYTFIRGAEERAIFRHDKGSWDKFWEDVGKETETKWEVETEVREMSERMKERRNAATQDEKAKEWMEGMRWLVFTVRRLE